MFKKILIANRGEIALRVMRSAKEMGIKTVAVYSDADRKSPHVMFADEAVHIGASPSNQSYLVFDKIIDAAKQTGAEAIHPGYGFLSENANFSEHVSKSGLVFIGPTPEAMRIMGSKLGAKDAAKKFNVPMVPGTDYAISDIQEAKQIAVGVGFPVLIKASAGGGGKGMRIVEKAEMFEESVASAMREAESAFGDGSVFIEKYVASPRHIEIQVMGDTHGNIVHLFERECSVQRRHQKVIEEAPSSVLDDKTREAMGYCAVMVAKACNYTSAGTVEFLLDENNNFYFLEMNTRLQVEHPVTEMITGIDLVKEQIRVAAGLPLSFSQKDLSINGHAVEVRVYAEDPANNFLPSVGTLSSYLPPRGVGVRVDDGYEQGMEIPLFYDPMIAKLITYGDSREQAIKRMIRAIDEYTIVGCETTLPFCRFVMEHKAFTSGKFDTHFVKKYFTPAVLNSKDAGEELIAAVIASTLLNNKTEAIDVNVDAEKSLWRQNRLK
ncbi:MAG TPA: acetyl-CoA carboxylase biotin carboxylase subunit [Bacteroidia bacterium]|nr:acetyl-CoA carboxylase biotin carboxylase subunit [Bacteroidia bacterium]HNU34897.1 acetyl-CoA carboxylase biotin carboxylase subunit [Bacteroidia bacterium]